MKTFIFTVLISITVLAHAGEIILLDNYRLEKLENESPDWGREYKQGSIKLESEGSAEGEEREREWGRERRERGPDAQVKTNERRNIEDYTIRKIKDKREIDADAIGDSPLFEYRF